MGAYTGHSAFLSGCQERHEDDLQTVRGNLGPFVKTQTTSGKVGAVVKILGTGSGTGQSASPALTTLAAGPIWFSATEISATKVPDGATSRLRDGNHARQHAEEQRAPSSVLCRPRPTGAGRRPGIHAQLQKLR